MPTRRRSTRACRTRRARRSPCTTPTQPAPGSALVAVDPATREDQGDEPATGSVSARQVQPGRAATASQAPALREHSSSPRLAGTRLPTYYTLEAARHRRPNLGTGRVGALGKVVNFSVRGSASRGRPSSGRHRILRAADPSTWVRRMYAKPPSCSDHDQAQLLPRRSLWGLTLSVTPLEIAARTQPSRAAASATATGVERVVFPDSKKAEASGTRG